MVNYMTTKNYFRIRVFAGFRYLKENSSKKLILTGGMYEEQYFERNEFLLFEIIGDPFEKGTYELHVCNLNYTL